MSRNSGFFAEMRTAMLKYDEELTKAGVMLAGDGPHPTSRGARVGTFGSQPVSVELRQIFDPADYVPSDDQSSQ